MAKVDEVIAELMTPNVVVDLYCGEPVYGVSKQNRETAKLLAELSAVAQDFCKEMDRSGNRPSHQLYLRARAVLDLK